MQPIQHGDVSIHPLKEKPQNLTEVEVKNKIFVVREGEATGHQHRIKGEFRIFQDAEGNKYIKSDGAEIEHYDIIQQKKAEHDTRKIGAGWGIFKQERGFNPIEEKINEARD